MYKQIFTPPIADYNTDDNDGEINWGDLMELFGDKKLTLAVNIWKESLFVYNLKDRVCAGCGKVQKKMNKCGGCKTIHYCSADCQKNIISIIKPVVKILKAKTPSLVIKQLCVWKQ